MVFISVSGMVVGQVEIGDSIRAQGLKDKIMSLVTPTIADGKQSAVMVSFGGQFFTAGDIITAAELKHWYVRAVPKPNYVFYRRARPNDQKWHVEELHNAMSAQLFLKSRRQQLQFKPDKWIRAYPIDEKLHAIHTPAGVVQGGHCYVIDYQSCIRRLMDWLAIKMNRVQL